MFYGQEDHNFYCRKTKKINFTKMSSSSLNGDSNILPENLSLQSQLEEEGGHDEKQEGKEKNDQEEDMQTEIIAMINSKMLRCRNSVLATQIQIAIPGVKYPMRRNTLPAALCEISERSLLDKSKEKKEVTFKIPRKSTLGDEIILEEHVISSPKDKLFSDKFVRKLAVSIEEKRQFRRYSRQEEIISFATKFQNYLANKYDIIQEWFDFADDTFKIVEGRHGTAVLAYFLFLRWLLYMNMIHFLLNILFIVSPHVLFKHLDTETAVNYTVSNITEKTLNSIAASVYAHQYKQLKIFRKPDTHVDHTSENITANSTMQAVIFHCKELYQQYIENNTVEGGFVASIQNLLHGTGSLESTVIFTGSYHPFNVTPLGHVYNVGFAFLCVLLATFIISCIMMIRYSSHGKQENVLAQNTRSNYYINETFSGWDYCVKDLKTACLQHDKIFLELKTSLLEDHSRKKISRRSLRTKMKINAIRLLVNVFIIMWLIGAFYLIYWVTVYQMKVLKDPNLSHSGLWLFYIQYLPTITIATLNCVSPTVFDILVNLEQYSSELKINISLIRNVSLYLSSVILLMCTVLSQVDCKPKDICGVGLDETCRSPRCWETHVGQELYKLTIVDLAVYIAVLFYDSLQYFITSRFENVIIRSWGLPIFFLPVEVLAPIYSQTIQW